MDPKANLNGATTREKPSSKQSTAPFWILTTLLLIMGAAISLPFLLKPRTFVSRESCLANLKEINGAKEQWALENRKPDGTPITDDDVDDVASFLKGRTLPRCPDGGVYTPNLIGIDPSCSLGESDPERHSL